VTSVHSRRHHRVATAVSAVLVCPVVAVRAKTGKGKNGDTQPQNLSQNRENRCYHNALSRSLRRGILTDAASAGLMSPVDPPHE